MKEPRQRIAIIEPTLVWRLAGVVDGLGKEAQKAVRGGTLP